MKNITLIITLAALLCFAGNVQAKTHKSHAKAHKAATTEKVTKPATTPAAHHWNFQKKTAPVS
jgi:hypothetical protein